MVFESNHRSKLLVDHSNSCWFCDPVYVDLLLSDTNGLIIDRPYLTIVIDAYSHCVMGFHLGFERPTSQIVVRALRHAILPKHYEPEYNLHCEWRSYGIPEHLCIDSNSNTNFDYLQTKASQLGIIILHQNQQLQKGIVERCFYTFSKKFFLHLPGYLEANIHVIPEAIVNQANLTLKDFEKILVQYIVDNYNQQIDKNITNQSRQQVWEAGLISPPLLIQEQELNI